MAYQRGLHHALAERSLLRRALMNVLRLGLDMKRRAALATELRVFETGKDIIRICGEAGVDQASLAESKHSSNTTGFS